MLSVVMDSETFLTQVGRRAQLDRESAERATQATLETIGERLSKGQARDIVEQLPVEFAAWILTDRTESFDVDELVIRIAKREGTDFDTAERHARVVFSVLREAITPDEVDDLVADLPEDMRPIVCNLAVPSIDELVDHVAKLAELDRDGARRALAAVLQTLAERLPRGEVDDLITRLPIHVHGELKLGIAHADDRTIRMPAEELVRRVAGREGVGLRDGTRDVRVVLQVLRDAIGVEEFSDIVVGLPRDYDPLLPAPP
jgi:uncharacterized protein (DUF2267 family)